MRGKGDEQHQNERNRRHRENCTNKKEKRAMAKSRGKVCCSLCMGQIITSACSALIPPHGISLCRRHIRGCMDGELCRADHRCRWERAFDRTRLAFCTSILDQAETGEEFSTNCHGSTCSSMFLMKSKAAFLSNGFRRVHLRLDFTLSQCVASDSFPYFHSKVG